MRNRADYGRGRVVRWFCGLVVGFVAVSVVSGCAAGAQPASEPPQPAASNAKTARPQATAAPSVPPSAGASSPAPRAEPTPAKPRLTSFGRAAPTTLFAASAVRSWVGLCQARADNDGNGRLEVKQSPQGELSGDRLQALLIDEYGTETPLDEFIGADDSGRFALYTHASKLWLADFAEHKHTELAPLDALSNSRNPPATVAALDAARKRVAFLKQKHVVVRDLSTGQEQEFDPLGVVQRLRFEPDGELLRVEVASKDTNGNGRVDRPRYATDRRRVLCAGPVVGYPVSQHAADAATTRIYQLAQGQLLDVAGFVASMGSTSIVRGPDAELWLQEANGSRQKLSAPTCNGRILHVDAASNSIVLGCAERYGARRDLYLRTPKRLYHLRLDVAAFETDSTHPALPHWLGISTRTQPVLLDLQRERIYRLQAETQILATVGSSALLARGKQLFFVARGGVDLNTNTVAEVPLRQTYTNLAPLQRLGHLFVIGKDLFDLMALTYAGSFDAFPLALSYDYHGLFPAQAADADRLAQGPVTWQPVHAELTGSAQLSADTTRQ